TLSGTAACSYTWPMSANGDEPTGGQRRGAAAGVRNPRARQRSVAIVLFRRGPGEDVELDERSELLRPAGVATESRMVQQRAEPEHDRYLGRGKLEELKAEIKRVGANLVACDDELAPRQERN